MKKIFISLFAAIAVMYGAMAQTPEVWDSLKKDVNVFLANDLGRNGYYDQKPIADIMGVMAESISPECVIAAGDIHHFDGVQSVSDPLWMTNYELIYSHPELMIEWLPVLGNHEYRGNTQAVLDYSRISRRWDMPARYYTKVFEDDSTTVRFVLIDTTPLIDKYREETDKYPDACLRQDGPQLEWLDALLGAATEDWVIVVGHHPIYADTYKDEAERLDMQRKVDTILRRHANVAMYLCGHIHNFQHIRVKGSDIDYVVNSSASLSRDVSPVEGTLFCSPEPGFSVISADKHNLSLYMIDKEGMVLHTVKRSK
jgi:hypothetical protein